MSEIIQTRRNDIRRQLLATASAFALFAVCGAQNAQAEDGADTPLVWIELGGQFDAVNDGHSIYDVPSALSPPPTFEVRAPDNLQHGPRLGWDSDASLTLDLPDSGWVLSGAIHYGRALRSRIDHQQPKPTFYTPTYHYAVVRAFYQVSARTLSTHLITDFKAGRDVGLGMFGFAGTSVLSLGVRYADFDSSTDTMQSSVPNLGGGRIFQATLHMRHAFTGLGPSLSWDESARVFGHPEAGSVWLDWGANAAILFGKQSTTGSHRTGGYITSHVYHTSPIARQHTRSVPNVGGYASVSYRLHDVKISLGYRADLFFGAIDGGIDTVKSYDRGFYGPFAKISVGIGG
jgi:iron complex outermembrane receptor protein